MPQYATYLLARGNGGYRDPEGRTAVHMLPWGYYQDGNTAPVVMTVGPNILGGPRAQLSEVRFTHGLRLESGYDRVFVQFMDEINVPLKDPNSRTELHFFGGV